ncbi:MAG: efflux RND transporter periplasmic adaptor subunit [Desulfovibrio sp.]|jgi:membrane fusion protein (multidrug efflux system)|nr:efflux RND transporter periplasmic adaptor subunit [Desulfovibrio sp.]
MGDERAFHDTAQETAGDRGSPQDAVAARNAARPRVLKLLAGIFLLAGSGWSAYWFFFLSAVESTDDAYTAGNQIRISSQVTGNVKEIFTDNTLPVKAGQLLVRLDDTDALLALERGRAALADTVRSVRRRILEADRLEKVAALRQAEFEKAAGDYTRRKNRKTAMAVSEEESAHALEDMRIAQKALEAAKLEYQSNLALVLRTPPAEQPAVREKAQELRNAWLDWKRCEIRSPADGYAARRSVQVGMHVTPGLPLTAVVPLHDIWVDANFKEVQLARMRVGQAVNVRADMYGRAVSYRGEVVGFSAGTGSSFSLLPPENATGNWIKVVQRVPVKIRLNKDDLKKNPLLVGLSCFVEVDVSAADGAVLAYAAPSSPENNGRAAESAASGEGGKNATIPETPLFSTTVQEYDTTEIDREIAEIIARNTE